MIRTETPFKRFGVAATLFALLGCLASISWAQPVVGLVYTAKQYERLEKDSKDGLRPYREGIEENGGDVVVLAPSMDAPALNAALGLMDALLLPGGIDVDPKFYGQKPHAKLEETDTVLDQFEFKALDHAVTHGLPVLGICRGHQVINVHFGGSLIQDIPSHFEGTPPVPHRYPPGSNERREHLIRIEAGTMLHKIFGAVKLTVNTYHHQAVDRLAAGFVVSACTEDGLIEAIERKGAPLMIGVQFHPEKLRANDARFNTLFVQFLDAARRDGATADALTAAHSGE